MCILATQLKWRSWKRVGGSVPVRRVQHNICNVLAIYRHLPFYLWPSLLLGAALSGPSHGFSSPWPAAFLALPTFGLSAPRMHLCRPGDTGIFKPVVNQGACFFSILFLNCFTKAFLISFCLTKAARSSCFSSQFL